MNTLLEIHDVAERLRRCVPRLAPLWRGDTTLAELCLDSLDTVELLCAVHEEFGLRLTEGDLPPTQTLDGLAAALARKTQT